MKRWFIGTALVLVAAILGSVPYIRTRPTEPFYGEWVVTRLVGTTPITAMTDEYAKEFIGKTATYSDRLARFEEERLLKPRYSKRVLGEMALFEYFHMRPENFNFLDGIPATIVDVVNEGGRDWTNQGSSFFLLKDGSLVTMWDGGFFEMKRTRKHFAWPLNGR